MDSVGIIAFTRKGCILALELADGLRRGHASSTVTVHGPERFAAELGIEPYGSLASWTESHFGSDDALVFVSASGIAVRAIAPYVRDKFVDPAVVSVDEAGRFAVPLLSGHVGGANELAREVAHIADGEAVVSTATDVNGLFAVDEWAARNGFAIVERQRAKRVSAALLDGEPVGFRSDFARVEKPSGTGAGSASVGFTVSLDDEPEPFDCTLHLVPKIVTVGVGCRRDTDPDALEQAVLAALRDANISTHAVESLASIDVKRDEPAIQMLASKMHWNCKFYSAEELGAVPGVFASSEFVKKTVGVDNVCERAACAGGNELIVGRRSGNGVTVAIALRKGWDMSENANTAGAGKLVVIGLGPGGSIDLTGRARKAIESCDLVVGYTVYVDLVRDEFPDKEILTTPMRKEVERCRMALEQAQAGRSVAMVCSGDPGVYGMAGLVLELAQEYGEVDIEVIPGVSASNGGAAVLGAPLMHDYCVISLSDLLTPWETIEKRLIAAAQADFVISLYNPSSHKRPDYLQRACDILLAHKDSGTICGTVRNIGREGEEYSVMSLGELRDTKVDMFTTVFIGNSKTMNIGGRMVTPRGYLQRED